MLAIGLVAILYQRPRLPQLREAFPRAMQFLAGRPRLSNPFQAAARPARGSGLVGGKADGPGRTSASRGLERDAPKRKRLGARAKAGPWASGSLRGAFANRRPELLLWRPVPTGPKVPQTQRGPSPAPEPGTLAGSAAPTQVPAASGGGRRPKPVRVDAWCEAGLGSGGFGFRAAGWVGPIGEGGPPDRVR